MRLYRVRHGRDFWHPPCRRRNQLAGIPGEARIEKPMSYVPFTNDYSADLAGQARTFAKQAARRAQVQAQIANGNQVLGDLGTECCSDPAFGGQSYFGVFSGTPATAVTPTGSVAGTAAFPLTPVDILTGSNGFPMQPSGKPWPRPLLPASYQRAQARGYPNFGAMIDATRLVPPCGPVGPPLRPVRPSEHPSAPVATPVAPSTPVSCPYPACSTGNVCLDLVTGCVLNSQIDPAQQLACALANYGVFGNKGLFLSAVIHGCQPPAFLGTPMPNPPQADPSMMATINAVATKAGLGGLGQDSTSQLGGFLAVVAVFGIVVWAVKK